MLTLSNKPLRLIASVEMFDGDAMFELFVAADFFNNDCKSKILFNCDFKEAKIVPAFIRLHYVVQTSNKQHLTIEISFCSFHILLFTSP